MENAATARAAKETQLAVGGIWAHMLKHDIEARVSRPLLLRHGATPSPTVGPRPSSPLGDAVPGESGRPGQHVQFLPAHLAARIRILPHCRWLRPGRRRCWASDRE